MRELGRCFATINFIAKLYSNMHTRSNTTFVGEDVSLRATYKFMNSMLASNFYVVMHEVKQRCSVNV